MYRKIAFASLALNAAFVLFALFAFLPWFMDIAKNMKIEMPMAMMWLISLHHFATNPQSIAPTVAILFAGFFALKTFRQQTSVRD
jgi:type II secretory pathway component PulF